MKSPVMRGDIVLTHFPYTDLKGASVRPALVVSTALHGSDLVLLGISSVVRGARISTDLLVDVSHPEFRQTGLRVPSVFRAHKLAAVEAAVVIRRMGRIGVQIQSEVDRLLRLVLGL